MPWTHTDENFGPDAPPEGRGATYNFEAHIGSVEVRAKLRKAATALREIGDHYSSTRAIAVFADLAETVEGVEADIERSLALADEREGDAQ